MNVIKKKVDDNNNDNTLVSTEDVTEDGPPDSVYVNNNKPRASIAEQTPKVTGSPVSNFVPPNMDITSKEVLPLNEVSTLNKEPTVFISTSVPTTIVPSIPEPTVIEPAVIEPTVVIPLVTPIPEPVMELNEKNGAQIKVERPDVVEQTKIATPPIKDLSTVVSWQPVDEKFQPTATKEEIDSKPPVVVIYPTTVVDTIREEIKSIPISEMTETIQTVTKYEVPLPLVDAQENVIISQS